MNNKAALKRPCVKCKKNVTEVRSPGLSCSACNKFFHFTCINIDNDTSKNISNLGLSWSCASCRQKPSNRRSTIIPGDFIGVVSSDHESVEKRLEDIIAEFKLYKQSTDEKIAALEQQLHINQLKASSIVESVQTVQEKADSLERVTLEKVLEIQGIPEAELENPIQAAQLIAEAIDSNIAGDFDCTTTGSTTKKTLSIRFSSKTSRDAFLVAGKRFNRLKKRINIRNEEHKIFVNEALSKFQKKLLYNAKGFVRERGYKCAWFVNGNVHIKRSDTAHPVVIRSQSQLNDLRNEAENLLSERARDSIQNERSAPINQE